MRGPGTPARRLRGSVLILVLVLISLVFVLGIVFLAYRATQYKAARQSTLAVQARQLAWVGLEQTRVKLMKDLNFPLSGDEDQLLFGLTENVYSLDGSDLVGSYRVVVDSTYSQEPYFLIRLTVTGLVGPPDRPLARRTLSAELDMATVARTPIGTSNPNPNLFQFVNFTDEGGY